jgi:YVTN family beta-propeller protein
MFTFVLRIPCRKGPRSHRTFTAYRSNRSYLAYFFSVLAFYGSACAATPYQHFEGRQTHPIAISPDGTRLFAVNTPDGRLSVFDISNPARHAPLLIAEIPVGLEPVSVRARSNEEVWVVNEVSDSVSVVNVPQRVTVETLHVPDEPADVVFAGGKAFVCCARNGLIRVFDAATRTETAIIPVPGNYPRSLTVSPDGQLLYAACLYSGNGTTILPAPLAPQPPAPANPTLPPAPKTALIVPATDSRINYTVLDRDIAEISVSGNHVIRWFSGVGTHLFDAAVHPVTGELWVPNSESLNLIATEPALKGHFIDHRVTRITLPAGTTTIHDLNPGIDYSLLPNPAALTTALAQPAAIVFQPDGGAAWIAAFNSDRVAKLDNHGGVTVRVDVRLPLPAGNTEPNDSRFMRGPRGLAINANGTRLYVLNKLSNTISVIDSAAAAVLTEVATGSYDPTPANIKAGRGYLYDARLSGNGTNSCASCHLDADHDGLAWDLGDPNGSLLTVPGRNLSIHDLTDRNRVMHPMKGPMVTQTLRGLQPAQKLHWRGDRATLADFNPTFRDLMGGELISDDDINNLHAYLISIKHHPNPNRGLDNSRPTLLQEGNANTGRLLFLNHNKSHCAICHTLPTGSDDNIDLMQEVGSTQPVKTPPLRTVYQRTLFMNGAGSQSISGFGLLKDGSGAAASLPIGHPYVLDDLSTLQELKDVRAFLLSFDTGSAPITGYSRTVGGIPAPGSPAEADLNLLEARASTTESDLIVRGTTGGRLRQLYWNKSASVYQPDSALEASLTRAVLLGSLTKGDFLTFTGSLPGLGIGRGIDRDEDGIPDGDEPSPVPLLQYLNGNLLLSWESLFPDWYPESSSSLGSGSWNPLTSPSEDIRGRFQTAPPSGPRSQFLRLRRTW